MVRFNPFKPPGARIKIDLDRSQGPYYPGDELVLEVTLLAETDLHVEKFWCGLVSWVQVTTEEADGYSTSWKTLDELEAQRVLAEIFEIAPGAVRPFQLRFWIPKDAYPPCSGIYISGGLQVQARLVMASQKDIVHKIEVPLVVPPPEKRSPAGEHKGPNQPEELDMRLWLPGLEFQEGELFEGRLALSACRRIAAKEVRLHLVRVEHGHGSRVGPMHSLKTETIRIAGSSRFAAG